jgi:hypothetical protein
VAETGGEEEFSFRRVCRDILLIVAACAFVLAFPFAMSILWFPETMISVYLGATCVLSAVVYFLYLAIRSEREQVPSSLDTGDDNHDAP